MRIQTSSLLVAAILALLLGWHSPARGGIEASENFDSTNSWNLTWANYTNSATNATGWVVNNAKIEYDSTAPSPYFACRLYSTSNSLTTFITSPLLSNGVGYVVFKARLLQANATNQIVVESSSGDGNWTIQGQTNHLTSAYTTWNAFTNVVLIPTNQYVRLRKLTSGPNCNVFFDNISITYPPANISVTNLTTTPAAPKENDSFSVTAQLSFAGYPDTVVATNYWKLSSDSSWTAIPMTTNQATVFTTVSNIPGQSAYSSVDYFVKVYQTTDISGSNTVFFSQTNTLTFRPHSSYTNMVVTSPINASLIPFANYLWQGVGYVSNSVSVFKYQGDSNGVMTLWGDSNQSASNLMAYGNADVGATNIILSTTNIGPHVFTFNETNGAYMIRSCVYENFETWINQPFGTNTNTWTLSDGAVTNDATGAFSGHYAILNGQPGASTNAYLRSPLLTNGVGDISFWYRKWGTNGAPSGSLTVQIASNPASTGWTTIATISNITQTTYSFVNIPWSDLNNQAVRILNNASGSNSRVSLDEVVVAAPGAAVRSANLATVPATPGILDAVNIGIDLIPNAFATITNVVLWYRGSDTNLLYQSQPMILSNANHYVTTNGIPPAYGAVYYAVQYFFTGIMGQSPVFVPSAGTNSLNSYTPTNTLPANYYRYETFDSTNSWNLTWANYTNSATNATGWVVNNAKIEYDSTAPSPYFACRLNGPSNSLTTFITSPLLSNGVGSVVFYARLYQKNQTNQILVESSSGDGNWTIRGQTNHLTSAYTNWNAFTNVVLIPTNQYVRLRKLSSDQNYNVFFDNILCTPYPAYVAVTNVNLNPGYPVVGQSASVSCDIPSLSSEYPAFNITPTLYWSLYGGVTSSIPMTYISGNTYLSAYPMLFTNATRDLPFSYWVRADFAGYHLSDSENQSPRYSLTNTTIVRALSSTFSNIIGTVNGSNFVGRMISNGLWQTVFTTPTTNSLAFSFTGNGYSAGAGYAASATQWGNTNTWQTALPLADTAGTGQTAFVISGSNNAFSGQYVIRFDEVTGQYLVNSCVFQDFDKPGEGDGTIYKQTTLSGNAGGTQQNFDNWTLNSTRWRLENFDGNPWTNYTSSYVSGVGGGDAFIIYSGMVVNVSGSDYVLQTFSNVNPTAISDSFIAQASHWGVSPLRGIGEVSYTYAATRTNLPEVPATIGVYLFDTNYYPEPAVGDPNYMTFKTVDTWQYGSLVSLTTNISSTNYSTVTVDVNTSCVQDVFFAQTAGTQSLRFASVSVKEWYDEVLQTNSDGWVGSEYWIEPNTIGSYGNACRLDTTRAIYPTNQFILSPRIDNGIKYIEFYYAGAPSLSQNPPTNIAVNFTVQLTTDPAVWTNTLDTVSTNFNNTSGINYYRYFRFLQTSQGGLYVRIKNSTAKPGALLLDRINIPGYATTNDWFINNIALNYMNQTNPPNPRQYFRGAAYLNSTRTNVSEMGKESEFPDTNTFQQIRTPRLPSGIGEISFRYRNWATNAPVNPAKLVIQAAQNLTGATNESDWTTTIATVTNIVNTNDYLYFTTSVYDASNRYIRIYNDDTYTSNVGRVCLDDVLVTYPLASGIAISNLTITPGIPLYSNVVNISADVYHLFLNPTNISLSAFYGTSTNYAGLSNATLSSLPMACVSSNLSVPGKWFRYTTTTPIPANAADTFIRYFAKASFDGYHVEVTSPSTNKSFASYPGWLSPLDKVNGTNQAFYVVLSCPTGSVWINEINVQDLSDFWDPPPKYVELCGLADVNLSKWTIQIMSSGGVTQDVYVITNSFILPNTTNGYGFFVLGDSITTNRNMTLTNSFPTASSLPTSSLPYEGGIRLIRKSGIYADAVSFAADSSYVTALTVLGFKYAGDDLLSGFGSLSMTGTGGVNNAFIWANGMNYSIGLINDSQVLTGMNQTYSTPPTINIVAFAISTSNIWVECSGGTNGWSAAPWYSTNLLNTNGWRVTTPFNSNLTPSNTYQIGFSRTNLTPCFYKIVVINGL